MFVKLSNSKLDSTWSFERLLAVVMATGKTRQRQF
jgi:hypothetical protein